MRTARKISIVLVALVVMTVGLALPAQAGTEGAFLSKINASRSAAGLPPLSMSSELVPDARAHSAEMMAAGGIFHSSNLAGVASGWESLAENVGVGPSVDGLHTAFMNSSGHRRNILGDFNYVGVGVKEADGQIWVTVIFMKKGAAPETTTTTTTTTCRSPPPWRSRLPRPLPCRSRPKRPPQSRLPRSRSPPSRPLRRRRRPRTPSGRRPPAGRQQQRAMRRRMPHRAQDIHRTSRRCTCRSPTSGGLGRHPIVRS